jgi:hypothetical protein
VFILWRAAEVVSAQVAIAAAVPSPTAVTRAREPFKIWNADDQDLHKYIVLVRKVTRLFLYRLLKM